LEPSYFSKTSAQRLPCKQILQQKYLIISSHINYSQPNKKLSHNFPKIFLNQLVTIFQSRANKVLREQGVAGSNPVAPTRGYKGLGS
jgi:hypothetical protein